MAALIAGGITWAIATFFISVTGASRELIRRVRFPVCGRCPPVGRHLDARKSQAGEWQRYLSETLGKAALSRSSAWFLFGLAFIAVYREVFETILFYAALTAQGSSAVILAGAVQPPSCSVSLHG